MLAGPTSRSSSATRQASSINGASRIVIPLIDSPPFDSIIVRGIAFRQRPSRSQKTSIENSSPGEVGLDDRVDRRVAQEEAQLSAVLCPVDMARAEAAARLDEQRERRIVGDVLGKPRGRRGDAAFLEQQMRLVLVGEPLDDVRLRQEDECAELVARAGERRLVEVGERRDQAHVVLVDERAQRGDVGGVVDPRHEGVPVGVIERGCERVRVGGDRQRAGATERADDVHPLSGAREEDGRHGGQYSRNGRLDERRGDEDCGDNEPEAGRAGGRRRSRTQAPTQGPSSACSWPSARLRRASDS